MNRGEVLLCREVTYDDAMRIANWLEDKEVSKHLNEGEHVSASIRDAVQRVNLPVYNSIFNRKGNFHLIRFREEAIGYANLIPKGGFHEIVIVVGNKALWGRGLGKSALRILLSHAFLEMRTQSVKARITHYNHRSIRLFKSMGFSEEKVCEKNLLLHLDFKTYLGLAA